VFGAVAVAEMPRSSSFENAVVPRTADDRDDLDSFDVEDVEPVAEAAPRSLTQ